MLGVIEQTAPFSMCGGMCDQANRLAGLCEEAS